MMLKTPTVLCSLAVGLGIHAAYSKRKPAQFYVEYIDAIYGGLLVEGVPGD